LVRRLGSYSGDCLFEAVYKELLEHDDGSLGDVETAAAVPVYGCEQQQQQQQQCLEVDDSRCQR